MISNYISINYYVLVCDNTIASAVKFRKIQRNNLISNEKKKLKNKSAKALEAIICKITVHSMQKKYFSLR